MTTTPGFSEERWWELLAAQATHGLSDDEERELAQLQPLADDGADDSVELAAAAIELACEKTQFPPLPAALAQKIADAAHQQVPQPAPPMPRILDAGEIASRSPARSFQLRDAGWLVAAAALLLAMWLGFSGSNSSRLPTVAQLAAQPDVIRLPWTTPDGKPTRGEVIWSNGKQQGYMFFRGLKRNDPRRTQYQLWIFDASRDERYPVDGGVFDIDQETDEVIVPIAARLPIREPAMFAITEEVPGGVVVSDRLRLPLLAKVGTK